MSRTGTLSFPFLVFVGRMAFSVELNSSDLVWFQDRIQYDKRCRREGPDYSWKGKLSAYCLHIVCIDIFSFL